MRTLEAIGSVRSVANDSRVIEGTVAPYGVQSEPTELLKGSGDIVTEVLLPGSFRDSVAKWMGRTDGARMPYRPGHGEKPIGVVTDLTDGPDGASFRASIFETPAGDEYLAGVRAGLNGVSPEFMHDPKTMKRSRGMVAHRNVKLLALAGSNMPAYDGARVSLRDMEEIMSDKETPSPTSEPPAPEPTPEPEPPARGAVPPISASERSAVERAAVEKYLGSNISITRPESVYGPDSPHTYMHDTWLISPLSLSPDKGEAYDRVQKHRGRLHELSVNMERDAYARVFNPATSERAGDVLSSEIPGAYPNEYVTSLLTPRIFKGRPAADSFQRIPIADARPRIFPKVTTSSTVATFAEGVAPTATDIATTAVTVTPAAYGTFTDVSRQALDGGDPSVLAIIFQDLTEGYRQVSETAVKTAVEAGATASGTAITAATPWAGELANVIKYYSTRFRPAEVALVPSALYSVLLSQGDTTGRPFMPMIGAMNSDGTVQSGGISGNILGANAKLSWANTVNVNVFAVSTDYVIFESAITQFTYDQVVGPQSVRVGLWAYLGIGARLGGLSVTAA
jgi:phage head maturation protease